MFFPYTPIPGVARGLEIPAFQAEDKNRMGGLLFLLVPLETGDRGFTKTPNTKHPLMLMPALEERVFRVGAGADIGQEVEDFVLGHLVEQALRHN